MTDWKSKLEAFLHDSPSKPLNIPDHWMRAMTALRQAGSTDGKIDSSGKKADHIAAAADRIPFPDPKAGAKCQFDGVDNAFVHPLSGQKLILEQPPEVEDEYYDLESSVQPALDFDRLNMFDKDSDKWRACFFAHWRFWSEFTSERIPQFAFLPADTRIPDHTIWNHVQIVSALRTTAGDGDEPRPAFLRFQIGPVQDFIASARSTRDLWSGSYLLSWLMAAGLKKLSEEVGPDAVVFPNLKGQPIFDLHWSSDLWTKVKIGEKSLWETIRKRVKNEDFLTPNLPNVFLALVPNERAAELGALVEKAIQEEWLNIAGSVWEFCAAAGLTAEEPGISQEQRRERFYRQVKQFLSISWNCTAWPQNLDSAIQLVDRFKNVSSAESADMPILTALKRVENIVRFASDTIPKEDRDSRFFVDKEEKTKLSNIGLAWSILVALNQWELDAVRQTRNFAAMNAGGWEVSVFNNKDSLTGKEEAVAGGEEWVERCEKKSENSNSFWPSLFKHKDWLGASTLIKRVWHLSYLKEKWGLETDSKKFPWPSTRDIALHQPSSEDPSNDGESFSEEDGKYFAVIAFDGDDIGKWVSGEKTPSFKSQLAYKSSNTNANTASGFGEDGVLKYLSDLQLQNQEKKEAIEEFLESQRPISPGYHLQFSETLTNFALYCARPIVEALDGRLIYAGGDDVVALVPADMALVCAEALKMAFRGESSEKNGLSSFLKIQVDRLKTPKKTPNSGKETFKDLAANERLFGPNSGNQLFKHPAEGFLARLDGVGEKNKPVPMALPGSKASGSAGIAIAHHKAPLQDVVREAQRAEKLAKKLPGKGAVNITVLKRSGEIVEWATWFNQGKERGAGVALYEYLQDLINEDVVSSRFPHRIVELLSVYRSSDPSDDAKFVLHGKPQTANVFDAEKATEVILKEIQVAADRQRGKNYRSEHLNVFCQLVDSYLKEIQSNLESEDSKGSVACALVSAVIDLCEVVAFSIRISR